MAERQDIEIVIKAKDLASGEIDEIVNRFSKAGAQVKTSGEGIEKGSGLMRLSLWSAGEAVENLTARFGIHGKAGRQVGNIVEDLIGGFGKAGLVIGGASMAVGAAALIWSHFAEQAKKKREELEKSITALNGEVAQLYRNIPATQEYNRLIYQTLTTKRELLKDDLIKMIQEETKALDEQIAREKERSKINKEYEGDIRLRITQGLGIINTTEQEARTTKDATLRLQEHKAELLRVSRPVSFKEYTETDKTKTEQEQVLQIMESMYDRRALIGLSAGDAELARLDAKHYAELNKLQIHHASRDQMEEMRGAQEIERSQLIAERQKQIDQQKMANTQIIMGGISNVMGMAYELSGRKMKAFFIMMKMASAAEAFIQYQVAASKAAGQFGVFGLPMVAFFEAMSFAVPAMIMAQAFTGPSGGGGGGGGAGAGAGAGESYGTPIQTQDRTAYNYQTYITIEALDPVGLQTVVEERIIPMINDASMRNITVQ
jgi:hypothetical protein